MYHHVAFHDKQGNKWTIVVENGGDDTDVGNAYLLVDLSLSSGPSVDKFLSEECHEAREFTRSSVSDYKAAMRRDRSLPTPQVRPRGHVYLLFAPEAGLHKIGRAKNLAARVGSLKTGSPVPLTLVHSVECNDYVSVERVLHKQFDSARRRGEWFLLTPQDVAKAKDAMDGFSDK